MKTFDELLPLVRARLGNFREGHRFRHTMGVVDTAAALAKIWGADAEKARIAALLHDATKHDDPDAQRKTVAARFGDDAVKAWPRQLLHGLSAVVFAEEECGDSDPEILLAIQNHSDGRPAMTLLEKIIFCADYLEPGRGPDPEGLRVLATKDLDKTVARIVRDTLGHVAKTGLEIAPLSLETEKYYDRYLEDSE